LVSDISNPVNLDTWKLNIAPITGRYPKLELQKNNQNYIVKFAAYRQNGQEVPYHVSEYISSKIITSLGYSAHEVFMAELKGRHGCLIKVFAEELTTFGGFGSSTLTSENLPYDLDLLHELSREDKFTADFEMYLWDTFCVDAFIINLDRHPNNWGFFKRDGIYYPAPLFDNASSLYSLNAFDLGKMENLEDYIRKFSKSMVQYQGERYSFEYILQTQNNSILQQRLAIFKQRLGQLNLDCIKKMEKEWQEYQPYLDFVKRLIERQVNYFETQL